MSYGQAVKDKSKINQLKSMEFMQWKFSPDKYYYSWVTRSRKVLGWKWTWREPGLGIHDRGPAGIGGGDGYVKKDKRNIKQELPMVAFVEMNKKKAEIKHEKADIIYKQQRNQFIDRSIDYQYYLFSPGINELAKKISKQIKKYHKNKGNWENVVTFNQELTRILNDIRIIKKSHLSNAKKRESYISYEEELKELYSYVYSINRFNKIKSYE